MAKSPQSVESLIKSAFALQVAVRCTEEVEFTCRKNSLSFSELLRPFCALSNNGEFITKDFVKCNTHFTTFIVMHQVAMS